MPVKEKLSGISLEALIPAKTKLTRKIIIKDDSLRSSQFVIPQNRKSTSSFTGRTKELDYLRMQYSKTLQQIKNKVSEEEKAFKPIITGIKGEPGIGKSRLMQEFLNRTVKLSAGKINNVVSGKNLKTSQNSLGPFAEIIPEFNQQKFLPCENGNYREAANFIKVKLFKKAEFLNSKGLPLVLAIEDMQWADENTLYILDHLLKAINLYGEGEQPLIFLMLNYRNSFKPTKVMWQESEYHELMLEALDEKNTFNLINNLTGSTKLNTKIRELIAVRADGNPFNIEEWCSLVTANKKLNRVPQTVRHLLVEKISGLTPGERSILIAACISGRKFDIRFVNEVLKRAGKAEAESDDIKNLEEKRYIINLTGSTYEFRHDILHETLYMQLEAGLRRELHKIAGEVTEELYKSKLSDHFYELARHYNNAKNKTKTIEYLEKAGDKAKDNYEHERALRFYNRLLPLLEKVPRIRVILKICDALKHLGRYTSALEFLRNIKKSILDKKKYFTIEMLKCECMNLANNRYEAISSYKKLKKKLEKDKQIELLCEVNGYIGKIYLGLSNFNSANHYFNLQLKDSIKHQNISTKAQALESIGILKRFRGNYTSALIHYVECKRIYNSLADVKKIAFLNDRIGTIHYYTGNFDAAFKHYYNAIQMFKEVGSYEGQINTLGNIAVLYTTLGQYSQAKAILKKSITYCQKTVNESLLANTLFSLGIINLKTNELEAALSQFKKSMKVFKIINNVRGQSLVFSNMGLVYQAMGKHNEALICFENQIRIDNKLFNKEGCMRGAINMANSLNIKNQKIQSIKYYKKGIRIGRLLGYLQNLSIALFNLADVYFDIEKYNLSLRVNHESYIINKQLSQHKEIIRNNLLFNKINLYAYLNRIPSNTVLSKIKLKKLQSYYSAIRNMLDYNIEDELRGFIYFELSKISLVISRHNIGVHFTDYSILAKKYLKKSVSLSFNKSFEIYELKNKKKD